MKKVMSVLFTKHCVSPLPRCHLPFMYPGEFQGTIEDKKGKVEEFVLGWTAIGVSVFLSPD